LSCGGQVGRYVRGRAHLESGDAHGGSIPEPTRHGDPG
jgi:hypothetical protein